MKKILILSLCTVLMSTAAFAQRKKKPAIRQADEHMSGQGYGTAGCGLGSIAFGQERGMIQIVAATLNATGVQTFAISTGTSNCTPEAGNMAQNTELFIEVNKDVLAKDISRGKGESIDNLSMIMGCENSAQLGTKLQQNYDSIFPNGKMDSNTSTNSIMNLINSDSDLSQNCKKVG